VERRTIVRNFIMCKALDAGATISDAAGQFDLSQSTVKQIWQRHLCDPTLLRDQYAHLRLDEVNNASPDEMRAAYQAAQEIRREANRAAWSNRPHAQRVV
jgi:transposase-like protein